MSSVETLHAIYAKLENRPGTLERVARALGDKKINIDALSLETVGGTGFARVVTSKAKDAVKALQAVGVEAYESDILVASLPNRPGELARATAELAAANVNLEAVTTTPDGRLAFRTSDNERAAAILRKI